MLKKYHRFFAGVVLALIVIYGVLKVWVLRLYANILSYTAELLGLKNNSFFQVVKNQASKEDFQEQTLGWLIYYPTYFLLHIVFIYLLFNNNRKVRNYLMIGLTSLITLIILLWLTFVKLNEPTIASFFRTQFRNLFGLPFILLAIEGGRLLYKDISKLV